MSGVNPSETQWPLPGTDLIFVFQHFGIKIAQGAFQQSKVVAVDALEKICAEGHSDDTLASRRWTSDLDQPVWFDFFSGVEAPFTYREALEIVIGIDLYFAEEGDLTRATRFEVVQGEQRIRRGISRVILGLSQSRVRE